MTTAPTPGQGAPVSLSPTRAHDTIAADTGMDAVTLLVGDLDRQLRFYRDGLALQVLDRPGDRFTTGPATVTLGRGTTPLVILQHTPDLPPAVRGAAGLFHTAILFDDEGALAATLASVAQREPGSFVGSADHLVSLAFYFTDPEGNGVELYWDRSRSLWQRNADNQIEMGSYGLDPNAFLGEHLTDELLERPAATRWWAMCTCPSATCRLLGRSTSMRSASTSHGSGRARSSCPPAAITTTWR